MSSDTPSNAIVESYSTLMFFSETIGSILLGNEGYDVANILEDILV